MAVNAVGAWSMPQLSFRLQQVAKGKQWQMFQRVMLLIVLMIWFAMVTLSAYFRLYAGTETGPGVTDAKTESPSLLHARKLAWTQ